MLKVLIADDEINICMLIKKLVNWESYDMQIIDVVHNGIDAMSVIEREKPDLVISDIRMPGVSGLDIVKRTRELELDTDFIIISGYKKFEYAHTAINMGVENYLLKPIDKKELEAVISNIYEKRKKNIDVSNVENELRQKNFDSKMVMRRHFLNTIMVSANISVKGQSEFSDVDSGFDDDCYVAFFTKADSDRQRDDMEGFINIIDGILNKALDDLGYEHINTNTHSGVISVLNYNEVEKNSITSIAEKCFNKLKQETDKFSGLHITMGVGSTKNSISEASLTIKEATDAVKSRSKTGLDKCVFYSNLHYVYVDYSDFMNANRAELKNMVSALDSKAFIDRLMEHSMKIEGTAYYSPVSTFDFFENILSLIIEELRNDQVSGEIIDSLVEKTQSDMDYYVNSEEMLYHLFNNISECFGKIMEERRDRTQRPIRMARKYIEENYSRQISQDEVADAIGLSSSYLSTMFKKELGINFSDYLNKCRIDAAKNLLKNTDEPLSVIAETVGYSEQRYFSKVFQKTVGLKPSVYRKMYS